METQPTSEAIRETLGAACGLPLAALGDEAHLIGDLGLDSLELTYALTAIDERFGVMLDGPVVLKLVTVADLVSAVLAEADRLGS